MTVRIGRRGFSLLEVMIAASLLAIVGMLLLTSISSSIDTKEAVDRVSNRQHVVRLTMSRLVDDISMAYLSAQHNAVEPHSKTGFIGERDSLIFTAFGNVPRFEGARQSSSRQLGLRLGSDPRTGIQGLLRREQPNLDDNFKEGGREQVLLPEVTSLELQYWDPQGESWKDKWDAEESATLGRLPSRVRIKLTARMDDGVEQTFVTQSRLWMLAPLKL